MFGLFKKKRRIVELQAPVQGKVIDITAVPDQVFSQKIMGDGVAFEPTALEIKAPCDGQVILIAKTKHAVALKTSAGLEILIHVGLDTVELEGQGFSCQVGEGDLVTTGDVLLRFDKEFVESRGKVLVTPMMLTNATELVDYIEKDFSGSQPVMRVVLK